MAQTNNSLLVYLTLLWWLIIAVVTAIIVGPVVYRLPDYPFLWANLLFIASFILLARYIFLLRFTFLVRYRYLKVAVIFLCLWLAFLLGSEINAFQTYLDENGIEAVVGSLPRSDQLPMIKYIRAEMLLFGVGALICCILLPIRLVVSIWRRWNGYEALN